MTPKKEDLYEGRLYDEYVALVHPVVDLSECAICVPYVWLCCRIHGKVGRQEGGEGRGGGELSWTVGGGEVFREDVLWQLFFNAATNAFAEF